jgi:hypothetical protein
MVRAAIAAAVFGGAWLAAPPDAKAGAWINRRGYGGGGGWNNGGPLRQRLNSLNNKIHYC